MKLALLALWFGPWPPWIHLTLRSIHANNDVAFYMLTDNKPPTANLPHNLNITTMPYQVLQNKLAKLTARPVAYNSTYKANDLKPLLPVLLPHAMSAGHEWWGWTDLDVIFGDLLKYLELATARTVKKQPPNVMTPFFPNPWRKMCWGPLTLFHSSLGDQLFQRASSWRAIVASPHYIHFDEWWGEYRRRGWDTMGDVLERLSEDGTVRMSDMELPHSEAKSCNDVECTFCPCGAMRFRLEGKTLHVNGKESMVLHLAEAKRTWYQATGDSASQPGFQVAPFDLGTQAASECHEVLNLGNLVEDPALRFAGALARHATLYGRNRPVSPEVAALVVYASSQDKTAEVNGEPLIMRKCAPPGTSDGPQQGVLAAEVRGALNELVARYEAFTSAERRRQLAWLCAWRRIRILYNASVAGVRVNSEGAKRLPGLHGNRLVRTPRYGGERLGWWEHTVDMGDMGALAGDASGAEKSGPCSAAEAEEDTCATRRWPPSNFPSATTQQRGGGGARGAGKRRHDARKSKLMRLAANARKSKLMRLAANKADRLAGRRLQRSRGRRQGTFQPIPGYPCLPGAMDDKGLGVAELQERLFAVYLLLHRVRKGEYARTQKWMCAWMYMLDACDRVDAIAQAGGGISERCRALTPPNETGVGLGWRGHDVKSVRGGRPLKDLLFAFRCW